MRAFRSLCIKSRFEFVATVALVGHLIFDALADGVGEGLELAGVFLLRKVVFVLVVALEKFVVIVLERTCFREGLVLLPRFLKVWMILWMSGISDPLTSLAFMISLSCFIGAEIALSWFWRNTIVRKWAEK
jgi:hypothetical protein